MWLSSSVACRSPTAATRRCPSSCDDAAPGHLLPLGHGALHPPPCKHGALLPPSIWMQERRTRGPDLRTCSSLVSSSVTCATNTTFLMASDGCTRRARRAEQVRSHGRKGWGYGWGGRTWPGRRGCDGVAGSRSASWISRWSSGSVAWLLLLLRAAMATTDGGGFEVGGDGCSE
jgi:hypothetical protein